MFSFAVQPEDLVKALVLGLEGGLQGGGVVAAGLSGTGAALHGTNVPVLNVDPDGSHAVFVVGAGGGADDVVQEVVGGMNAQLCTIGDHGGPQVQGGAFCMGDPILLQFHQGPHGTDLEFRIQLGHAHPLCAPVHPVGVLQRAEHLQAAVLAAVGLETFKNFLAVVEHGEAGSMAKGP